MNSLAASLVEGKVAKPTAPIDMLSSSDVHFEEEVGEPRAGFKAGSDILERLGEGNSSFPLFWPC